VVVSDVNRGHAEQSSQAFQFGQKFGLQISIQAGDRLVERQQARAPDNHPRYRHTQFAAGELIGVAGRKVINPSEADKNRRPA
jgi:hypothetical protein